MKILTQNKQALAYILVTAVMTAFIPFLFKEYMQTIFNSVLIYFIATLGITVTLGMGGQVSFATAAFIGMGGYISAVLSMKAGIPVVIAIVIAMAGTGIMAGALGLVLFRLSSQYVTFATIALTQIMWTIYQNFREFTGGPDGIPRVPDLNLFGFEFTSIDHYFYLLMVICLICSLVVERIRHTSFGRSLASVRDNEIAAKTLGVNVYRTKILSFITSSVFAALAGALLTHQSHYISAASFTFDQSTTYVIMAMLGGIASTPGAFLGSFIVTVLPEWFRPLMQYIRLMFGVVVILLMVFMPMGLMGMVHSLWKWIRLKTGPAKKQEVSGDENNA